VSGSFSAFSGHFSPATVRWWHAIIDGAYSDGSAYGHFDVLRHMIGGRSAEETEQLEYCHARVVVDGARSTSGLWCVCLNESAPATVSGRGGASGDGMSALVCIKQDLERAADALPILWKSTERIFKAQGRTGVYGQRRTYYLRNLKVREIDRWQEPRDPDSGHLRSTSLAFHLMSRELGGVRDVCDWPCKQPAQFKLKIQVEAAA
jgi:hypothetical protein